VGLKAQQLDTGVGVADDDWVVLRRIRCPAFVRGSLNLSQRRSIG
jgi:hypothetical protein